MDAAAVQQAAADILAKNPALIFAVASQIGLPGLLDTWMTPHMQNGGMLCLSSVVYFCARALGHNRPPLGGIVYLPESPRKKRLRG